MATTRFMPKKVVKPHYLLGIGDQAVSLFESSLGRLVSITNARVDRGYSSGVAYQVTPTLYGCRADDWFDAEWFRVATAGDIIKLRGARHGAKQFGGVGRGGKQVARSRPAADEGTTSN